MNHEERNALLEEIAYKLTGDPTGGTSRGLRVHMCSSCDMTDEERIKYDGWNDALWKAAALVRSLKTAPPLSTMT